MTAWKTNPNIKAAFFDADGTLLSFASHGVPASAREAIHTMRANGIKCFLCTGRPPYYCDDIPIDDLDAFILFNGQLILDRYGVKHEVALDPKDVAAVVEQVKAGLYNCIFFEREYAYVNAIDASVQEIFDKSNTSAAVEDVSRALDHDIYQLNAYLRPGQTNILLDATESLKVTRWSPNFVDVFPIRGGKGRAVRRVLEMYGIEPDEAICFGDGGNDVEMFGVVGTAIAMGNASEDVKEAADYVTTHVDEDGIWNACKNLGLI